MFDACASADACSGWDKSTGSILWDGGLKAGTGPNLDVGYEIVLAGDDTRMGATKARM